MKLIQLVIFIIGISIILSVFSENVIAQEAGGGSTAPSGQGVSFHMGPLLPNSIGATDEILSGVGFRYVYPAFGTGLLEAGYTGSNSEGISYSDVNLSIRGDVPLQDLFAFGLVGLDLTRIKGATASDYTYYGGLHAGGGILAHIADTLFLRMEMRFNFHPGTILFFGFGFEYRFGGGGGGN